MKEEQSNLLILIVTVNAVTGTDMGHHTFWLVHLHLRDEQGT